VSATSKRWRARIRAAKVGESAIRGRHGVLRAALAQALRWEWVGSDPASQAVLRQPMCAPRDAMSPDEVRAAIAAARVIAGLRRAAFTVTESLHICASSWSPDRLRARVPPSRSPGRGSAPRTGVHVDDGG
jgi:hypothetical protein